MLQYTTRNPGIENVIAWIFKSLKYKVLNPCFVLKIYHYHCSRIKLSGKEKPQRINLIHSYSPTPTSNLY